MHKKIIILFSIFLVACFNTKGQISYAEEVDAIQAVFGKEKKQLITDLIKLTPEEAEKFWPVYDSYETERKKLGKQRIEMLESLADAYKEMTPAKADLVSKQTIKLAKETDELLEKYHTKVRSAVNGTVAFEFLQAEIYIVTAVRAALMDKIPMYSTIKDSK